jgi:hypothetical protein
MSDLKERLDFHMGNKEIRALLGEIPGIAVTETLSRINFEHKFPTALPVLKECLAYDSKPSEVIETKHYTAEWASKCLESKNIMGDGYICYGNKSDGIFAKVTLTNPVVNLFSLLEITRDFTYYDMQNHLLLFFFNWENEVQFYARKF